MKIINARKTEHTVQVTSYSAENTPLVRAYFVSVKAAEIYARINNARTLSAFNMMGTWIEPLPRRWS
jgi:hypothetical protein